MLTVERDEFCTARFIALTDENLVQPVADIGSRIGLQGPQEIGMANQYQSTSREDRHRSIHRARREDTELVSLPTDV